MTKVKTKLSFFDTIIGPVLGRIPIGQLGHFLFLTFAAFFLMKITTVPENEFLKNISIIYKILFYLAGCTMFLYTIIRVWYEGRLYGPILLSARLFFYLALVQCMVMTFGGPLYEFYLDSPDGAIAVFIAIIFFLYALHLALPSQRAEPQITHAYAGGFAGPSTLEHLGSEGKYMRATSEDYDRFAAHETGHALLYSVLGTLPSDLTVTINSDKVGSFGHVCCERNDGLSKKHDELLWHMMLCLGGKMGERHQLGEHADGMKTDMKLWEQSAKLFLSVKGGNTIFYLSPENDVELAHNNKLLVSLREEQEALLAEFFTVNEAVFQELHALLLEQRTLKSSALFPFLSRVVLIEGIPLPNGPFDELITEGDIPQAV